MRKNMKNKLIYIENSCHDPHYNLAFEEYVFSKVAGDTPVLLLWQNEPSVIIGKYQNTIEEINYDFIREHGIHVVRRNTGGGAVYHDLGNLNFSFIVPDAETKIDFQTFSIPVVKALQSQGIDARQTGRNDILVDGKKFSGNAQQFSNHRLLHHGTLMFDVDMDAVIYALKVKEGKFRSKATKSVRSRVTNLKPYFRNSGGDCPAETGDFKLLLLEWFRKEYNLEILELTRQQLDDIDKLRREKYDTDTWNFGRSPKADVSRGDFFRCGYVEFNFTISRHTIESVSLVGDFFSSRPIEELENALAGVSYDREALLHALENLDVQAYLGDVSARELVDVIV